MEEKYKFLPHTADIKFQAFGETLEESFKNSALALKHVITNNIEIKNTLEKTIKVKADDLEGLLYEFLEEFLYLLDAEDFIISGIEHISINPDNFELTAEIRGDRASNYKISNQVKAITCQQDKGKQGWIDYRLPTFCA